MCRVAPTLGWVAAPADVAPLCTPHPSAFAGACSEPPCLIMVRGGHPSADLPAVICAPPRPGTAPPLPAAAHTHPVPSTPPPPSGVLLPQEPGHHPQRSQQRSPAGQAALLATAAVHGHGCRWVAGRWGGWGWGPRGCWGSHSAPPRSVKTRLDRSTRPSISRSKGHCCTCTPTHPPTPLQPRACCTCTAARPLCSTATSNRPTCWWIRTGMSR